MILVSPLDGWSSPLDEVPDPVFSQKAMGDGLAIDPTSATLHAPCDGEVVAIPAGKHAVTLRAANGAEILLHLGVDTVALGGHGFELHTSQGASVRAGDRLLSFDLDGIATQVPSLMTPIIVVDGNGFEIVRREQHRSVRAGDFLMELRSLGPLAAADTTSGPEIRKRLRVPYEHGIHARPAAQLVRALREFSAEVSVLAHGRKANARSAVAWMELGVRRDDEITVIASGRDAEAAVAALERAIGVPNEPGVLRGVIASRGLAIGPAARIPSALPVSSERGAGVERETADLDRARAVVRDGQSRLRATANGLAREVLDAHLAFIDDPELLQAAHASIRQGKSAGAAWCEAVEQSVKALLAVGDPRVAERADDLRDLAGQVVRALAGQAPLFEPPAGSILVGQELLPSQLVGLAAGRIAGFCTAAGGPTSHVALLAAAMNIPALVAAGPEVLRIDEGTPLLLDAHEGFLRVAPDAETTIAAQQRIVRHRAQREAAQVAAHDECRLASGERIEVFANVATIADAAAAVEQGAEGCGLLRTEFLFLDRETPPDTATQAETYRSIVSAFGGRPVVIRTLDAGSDKPLRYLPLPGGDNPALGVRGVRASLSSPELLREQLRAILRVEPLAACRILLPMITDVFEVESVRQMLEELCREAGCPTPLLGVMIETPAAALIAERLAEVADFFSIGSNDLSQYTLAMDRGQPELAAQLDALHPSVLRLIRATALAGRAAGRLVAVCGGLASDPVAAPLLVGLGVNELSAVPSIIPELKSVLRATRLDDCRVLAERALEAKSAAEVRALARAGGNR